MKTTTLHASAPSAASITARQRPVVLIVDDVSDNLLALEGGLRRDDIEIISAGSGGAALEVMLDREIAVAIVDVQMPEVDGFELASLMRGVEKTRHVPIIFVTAGSYDQTRVFKGYELGAVDYLFKPIDMHVLRSKVDVFVTLERNRQELREADRMREMFIAVLGHDLRNPLGGMMMGLQLLEARSNGNDDILGRMRRNGRRMGHMIHQLLETTRLRQDGSVSLQPEPANLRELTDQIVEELGRKVSRTRLEVQGDMQGQWDVDRLLQILSNLIGNALEHSPPASPISIRIDGSSAQLVTLRIHNAGPPIPQQLRGTLFDAFRRPDRLRRAKEGLGLGLYIAKQFSTAHGGELTLESSDESGTLFRLTLPRCVISLNEGETGQQTVEQQLDRATGNSGTGSKTILLVEDEAAARLALDDLLQSQGYRVLAASRPSEALQLSAEHPHGIHLLLSDLRLPEMAGETLAQRLLDSQSGMQVILMSGIPDPPKGRWTFVRKPIDIDQLAVIVEQTLHESCRPAVRDV